MRLRQLWMPCSVVWLFGCSGEPLVSSGPSTALLHPAPKLQPKPIWGGSLLLADQGRLAVVSDADHDQVWLVDLLNRSRQAGIALPAGSAPARMALDGDGRVAVVLRGSGELARIDLGTRAVVSRQAVCPEPRGVSFDPVHQVTRVACEGGELVSLSSSGALDVSHPATDLRDVVPVGSQLWVSTWRSANLVPVNADGTPGAALVPPSFGLPSSSSFVPGVAWRALPTPQGDVVVIHQRDVDGPVGSIQLSTPVPAYYSNYCTSPVVRSAATLVKGGQVAASVELALDAPVDAAISPDGTLLSVVSPSQHEVQTSAVPQPGESSGGLCVPLGAQVSHTVSGQPIGIAYAPDGTLVVHEREPFQLEVFPAGAHGVPEVAPAFSVAIADYTAEHAAQLGFNLFHTVTKGNIACMSCHPEAGDDGHLWSLAEGKVRTQALKGGLTPTAPFHWAGDLADVPALLGETFVKRMGGETPSGEQAKDLGDWLDSIPASRPSEPAADPLVAQGEKLFTSAACASCHSGPAFTNNQTVDVGTGGRFQVPSLRGVASHGPWMHDGCAQTLRDRFTTCGGTQHGSTAGLAPGDVDALVAYLRSL